MGPFCLHIVVIVSGALYMVNRRNGVLFMFNGPEEILSLNKNTDLQVLETDAGIKEGCREEDKNPVTSVGWAPMMGLSVGHLAAVIGNSIHIFSPRSPGRASIEVSQSPGARHRIFWLDLMSAVASRKYYVLSFLLCTVQLCMLNSVVAVFSFLLVSAIFESPELLHSSLYLWSVYYGSLQIESRSECGSDS